MTDPYKQADRERWLRDLLCGALIGAGAILPGVSGGVLAVVFDVYRPMMETLSHPGRGIRKYWHIFLPLGIGWAVGFLGLAKGISAAYALSDAATIWLFIGLIAGASFRALSKRKEKPVAGLLIFAGASVLLSVFLFVFFSTPSAQSAFVPALRVGLLIFAGFLVVLAVLSRKLSVATFSVVMASGLAVLFNLAGEFIFGAAYKMLEGSAFVPALITSAASLPATLFNGIFSIVGAALLYFPLKKALQSAHLLNA